MSRSPSTTPPSRIGAHPALAAAAAALAALGLLATPGSALAGGGLIPEMGTRETAMGAVVGRPDDLSAIYHNPAGLILSPGTNVFLHAGLSLVDTRIQLRPWPGSSDYIKEPVDAAGYYPQVDPSRAFGVVPMLVGSTSFAGDRAVVALGIYFPNALGAAFDADSVARYHMIESYAVTGSASLALAVRVLPTLALGASFSLLYTRLSAERALFPHLGGLDLSGFFGGDSRLKLEGAGWSANGTLGLLWQPHPSVSIGAAVITRSVTTLEGDVEIALGKPIGGASRLSGTQRTDLIWPWTLQLGANWNVTRWLELGVELRYWYWSELDEQRTEVEGIPLIDSLVSPKGYGDSWHVGGGILVRPPMLPALELMLGGHYDRSPAPDQTVSMEQPSFHHIGLRTGLRYRLSERLRLALTYVHYWYTDRNTRGSRTTPPSDFSGGGVNHIFSLIVEWRVGSPGPTRTFR